MVCWVVHQSVHIQLRQQCRATIGFRVLSTAIQIITYFIYFIIHETNSTQYTQSAA